MTDYATLARIEDHLRRQADASERIADALERAHPAKFNPGGLVQPPWDIAVEPVPNQPGVFREVKHAAWDDCERPADPLDESDHRPRHNRYGGHVYRHGPEHWHDYGLEDGRCDMDPAGDDPVRLADFPGPLTFCDCDDTTIEAENGATD